MPGLNLRIAETDWEHLRKYCSPSFRGLRDTEYGAIGILGMRSTSEGTQDLIVARILWPEPGDVLAYPHSALTFSSQYIRKAHLAVREAGLAGIITVHTHPHAKAKVGFSRYDDEQDPLLIENLQELWPRTLLVSMVLGEISQHGRVWTSPLDQANLTSIVAVGRRLQYLPLNGEQPTSAPKPSAIFDRSRALTGDGALARLTKMTIAVVGASGTGSLVCELLARAGCKRILLIDHDVVKWENLNRILHATTDDAKHQRPKAEVLERAIGRLKLGCNVVSIIGSILDQAVLTRLNEADLVFGCVDKDYPRILLCQYAYRYLVPYIDVGAEIGGDDEGIVSTDVRTSYVAPGRPCLRCTGLVTQRRLRFESIIAAERNREAALGYSDDLLLTQPAVMDLNMRAASAGAMLLRHLLQPFLLEPLPATLTENLVTYTMRPVKTARAFDPECSICRTNPTTGYGDCAKALGLSSELALALLDPD